MTDPLGSLQARWAAFVQLDRPPRLREAAGLEGLLRAVFPVEAAGARLEYLDYALARPYQPEDRCRLLGLTYGRLLALRLRLSGDRPAPLEQDVLVCVLPAPLERGTFVVCGKEVAPPFEAVEAAIESGLRAMATLARELMTAWGSRDRSPISVVNTVRTARTIERALRSRKAVEGERRAPVGRDVLVEWRDDLAGAVVSDALVAPFTSRRTARLALELREGRAGRDELTSTLPAVGAEVAPGDVVARAVVRSRREPGEAALVVPDRFAGRVTAVHRLARVPWTAAEEERARVKAGVRALWAEREVAMVPWRAELTSALARLGARRRSGEPLDIAAETTPAGLRALLSGGEVEYAIDPVEAHRALQPLLDRYEDEDNATARRADLLQRGDSLPMGVLEKVIIDVTALRPLGVGDRLATSDGDEVAVVEMRPAAAMRVAADGARVEVLLPRAKRPRGAAAGEERVEKVHLVKTRSALDRVVRTPKRSAGRRSRSARKRR